MYYDLYLPFPLPPSQEDTNSKKAKKGKGKAPLPPPAVSRADCWDGLETSARESVAKRIALTGHLGYSVVGCTIAPGEPSNQVLPSPFQIGPPYPSLDPRFASPSGTSPSSSSYGNVPLVQVTRYHIRLDDGKAHCLTAQNTSALRNYDILSVSPTTDKSFQLACTDLSNPGPNQISIITLPLHERAFTFRFNRKQMRQAQRNGVVFELVYSAALSPPTSTPLDVARRFRQNFLSNAREVIRITGGKSVIFSSGPGGSENGLRGCLDIVNLGTLIGMPANLAREAVDKTPKMVLLRAQARKTFKAIMTMPVLAPPLADADTSMEGTSTGDVLNKRAADDGTKDAVVKRSRVGM
ncbi:hypothetical protein CNAG_02740 [Cryptococcus neoformans var. grubii H99]|uniref:Uncharacterized protein n=1 Tax=Cryptococcus neoformans (strain H99 / ATCC 208821 / CBS 10515 / FGSC 9487) TaxID=235443 RepID=J9VQJ1_CRYN9|nr:hypothetical protein CNAG_02740 [Cryptococcus neoformans var. grubii H99]AFR93950.1 hypothetical protein CNAG_02740 [Cryptococcus neoformans var. grubii H99]AUB23545.1 hypothetical protein CKF44_02740 [Cryptococcus neoformans var. grubii]|eukprot:XP_012048100.1 hypothetical protein CNAG_02740 [Cryptococcus neoformans var. grubii H99]